MTITINKLEMTSILLQIFFISFLINLFWEVLHSQLYETCWNLPLNKYISLIIKASLKDGFWVLLFYGISVLIFKNVNILNNYFQLLLFVVLSLSFSFIDEKVSLKLNRWQYSQTMPKIFGVGIAPLFEIVITGIAALLYVFIF